MSHYENIISRKEKIALIGLGYVGLPIAVSFSKKADVIGFDINEEKVKFYRSGTDPTHEVGNDEIRQCAVEFTSDERRLMEAGFYIVAVPTPVKADHTPDLSLIEGASRVVGRNLARGSVIVYESTVYPGVTQDVCVPILEKESGLTCGIDFKIGYSPERINPGDRTHRLETVIKIVSGMDEETLEEVASVYSLVAKAGIYRAESIRVAEAAKVIENSQRDINIAFMNELAIIFNKMNIDTKSVLRAAGTKWNFMNFYPGLVGGHCIGIDPYYLTYKAEMMGYHSQVILAGRRINDDMGKYVAECTIKKMIFANIPIKCARVAVLGFTFKENCPDTRNTRVIDIVNELKEYGIEPVISDPVADAKEAKTVYQVHLFRLEELYDCDAVILAVAHNEFAGLGARELDPIFRHTENRKKVLVDVKGLLDRQNLEEKDYTYWRL